MLFVIMSFGTVIYNPHAWVNYNNMLAISHDFYFILSITQNLSVAAVRKHHNITIFSELTL